MTYGLLVAQLSDLQDPVAWMAHQPLVGQTLVPLAPALPILPVSHPAIQLTTITNNKTLTHEG